MKSKVIGILVIMLIVMLPVSVFAYSGIDTNISIGGTDAAQSSVAVTNRIVGVLQTAGTIISVIALIIIGMRYMISSVEEKAQMKGVIGYYIIGCVLVFATSNVLGFAYTVVDDMKHSWVITETPATCTTTGSVLHKCKDCDEEYTTIIPALGHDYGAPVTHGATCIEGAYTTQTCKRCDDVHRVNTAAALEHDWKEVSRTAATCESNGTIEYICNRDSSHKYTDNTTLIAKGHTSVTDAAVQKTCTTDGKTAGSHCSVCNKVLVPQTVIAKGHTPVTDSAVQKTCTTDGKTEGSHCSVCNEVLVPQTTIPAGHEPVSVDAVAAKCKTPGKTAGTRCAICSSIITGLVDTGTDSNNHEGKYTRKYVPVKPWNGKDEHDEYLVYDCCNAEVYDCRSNCHVDLFNWYCDSCGDGMWG